MCWCAWLTSRLTRPEHRESMRYCQEKNEKQGTKKCRWAEGHCQRNLGFTPPQQCHKLIASMPRRIEAVIKTKGALTKYHFNQTGWSDLCVEHWLLSDSLCKLQSHWIIAINSEMNVWKCKLIFPTDTLQQKIDITDLKPFLAGENSSVLIILATTVCGGVPRHLPPCELRWRLFDGGILVWSEWRHSLRHAQGRSVLVPEILHQWMNVFTFKYIIVVTAWFFSSFYNISYGKTLRPTCEREKDKLKLRINTGLLCAKTQFQISYSMHKNSCEAPNYFTALYGAYCTDVLVEDFQTQSWLTFHLTDQTHTHI